MFSSNRAAVGVDGVWDDITGALAKVDTKALLSTASQVGTAAFSTYLANKETAAQIKLQKQMAEASAAEAQRQMATQQTTLVQKAAGVLQSSSSGYAMPLALGVLAIGVVLYVRSQ